MNASLKIYSSLNTNRVRFVFDLIFKQLLGIEYDLVSETGTFHIVYSRSDIGTSSVFIPQYSELLNMKGFEPLEVPIKYSGAETLLFPVENEIDGKWNFDLFSAVFYLVSRYEEYAGFEPDAHQRFPPEASILFKTQSFEFPLINLWVQKLKQDLLNHWPDLKFKEPSFKFISTIDVDSTFQYKGKGLLWTLSGLFKDLFKGHFAEVKHRIKTITALQKDAYDVFDEITKKHQEYSTEVKYFFLLGDYGPFDKNIPWKNKQQADVIQKLSQHHAIGLHPSYSSNTNEAQLRDEITRLKSITDKKPNISRQHFLIHRFPKTCQTLLQHVIKEDHTLGYTSQFGFRAGIASPFYFYDLEKEEAADLLLYPFCSMDITPMHYYKLTIEQAIEKNLELLKKVKAVNGTFISLWHNESISGTGRWEGGWPKVYEQMLKDAFEISL